jgi:uncharacterized coiled-coil DUF342 family protein
MIVCVGLQQKDPNEIDALNQKITSLLNYRVGLITEIKNLHQKRRDLRNEIRALSEKARSTRDGLNKGYNEFKEARSIRRETLAKIRDIRQNMLVIEGELGKVEQNLPRREGDTIEERIRAADWKLQTERLTREEERQLVEMVKDLELKLRIWKKAYAARQELSNLRSEMNQLKRQLDSISTSREKVEVDLETGKTRLTYDMKARDQLFNEMEELNEDISEIEQTIAKTDSQLEELRQKRREMLKESKTHDRDEAQKKEQEILAKARDAAKEKLIKGEKLTFDELKLALEDEQQQEEPSHQSRPSRENPKNVPMGDMPERESTV